MAIQNRRGLVADLDTTKMVAGEFAVPLDSKEVYVAFASGDTKRMATWEDFNEEMTTLNVAVTNANTATQNANTATQNCEDAIALLDNITANDILTKIKTVDGTGSELDADLLDGQHGSYYSGWIGTFLTANKTVYVATTGNDTTGDGTSGKPYKTIAKGLSVIPKNLNGFDATLYIAGGTYAENVTIKGFNGGELTIMLQGNVTINSLTVSTAQWVLFNYASVSTTLTITNTTAYPIIISYSSFVRFNSTINVVINTATNYPGIYCHSLSQLSIDGTATVNNAKYGVRLLINSSVSINKFAGTGNDIGIQAESGSIISYGTKTISATTEKVLSGGSIITNLITMP